MWLLSGGGSALRLHQLLILTVRRRATAAAQQSHSYSTAQTSWALKLRRVTTMDGHATEYSRWTKDSLIKRIRTLEREVRLAREGSQAAPSEEFVVVPAETATDGTTEAAAAGETDPESETTTVTESRKRKKKIKSKVDPSKYSTRLIALKLAYLGKNYGGFEYNSMTGTSTTIEEELWKALVRACLIFPEKPEEVNFDPWEYSKCGRTDRGVSAFGQVIAIRVRSNRPLPKPEETKSEEPGEGEEQKPAEKKAAQEQREFDDFADEVQYAHILNRLLPPDIRILAWCPTTPEGFSARHHCRERQYRYFFTQPAYSPIPHHTKEFTQDGGRGGSDQKKKPRDGWLDIEAMRTAAKKYEGLHDFRNFCKIDGTKSQQSYERRVFESDVVEVAGAETAIPHLLTPAFLPPEALEPSERGTTASPPPPPEDFPKVYYFHVRGSAFIWHQIRCMVAVLFAVGQGLEDASVVDRLLDVASEPRRPAYVMAAPTPLVLWDCVFPRNVGADDDLMAMVPRVDAMDWAYVGEEIPAQAHGPMGLVDHLWGLWRGHKMDELLAGQLLGLAATRANLSSPSSLSRNHRNGTAAPISAAAVAAAHPPRLFEGGDRERRGGRYVPMLEKQRLPSPQEAYNKEARRKGFRDLAHMQEVVEQRMAQFRNIKTAKAAAAAGVDLGLVDEVIKDAGDE